MPSSKDKTRIVANHNAIRNMMKARGEMIQAFQTAVRSLQRRIDEQGEVINMLCKKHPEILEQLQVQSEEARTNEADSGDEKPRILRL